MDTTNPAAPFDPLDPSPTVEPVETLERGDAPDPGERAEQRDPDASRPKPRREPLNLDDLFDL